MGTGSVVTEGVTIRSSVRSQEGSELDNRSNLSYLVREENHWMST